MPKPKPLMQVSGTEFALIVEIAKRAVDLANNLAVPYHRLDAQMDVTACHANGCPLDLKGLLEADDTNFVHDVFGIRRHLDRETGKLLDCFVPRYAIPRALLDLNPFGPTK